MQLLYEPISPDGQGLTQAPRLDACLPGWQARTGQGPTWLTEASGLSVPFQEKCWEARVQAHPLPPDLLNLQGTQPGPQTQL